MSHLSNMLLIAGSGRKCGKTTLACALIKIFSSQLPITGIKISPHFHESKEKGKLLCDYGNYRIFRETSVFLDKDSSLMLAAGAEQVFYIETTDAYLKIAFQEVLRMIPMDAAIICESPALRKYFNPGIFIFLEGKNAVNSKMGNENLISKADKVIDISDAMNADFLSSLTFNKSKWLFSTL